ncbi:histone deacetylase hos3 [Colletotrichum karsti]|uniref:Histone deacetylase hos3 n=1 Tax=Colletotrichum karsti TaxID=1095194 RepID=A0A9P6IDV7_9PEZI|nr:histone deacetylase hos3 [Colletotrichum karsti]KAF9881738.1 histone deacetylase hos3 [Colletotrichum karsti]
MNTPTDADKELSHSLKQLSLSTGSPASNSPRTPSALSPLRPAVNRASPGPVPSPRMPSRSPSFARELSRSRSSTPTLQQRSATPTLQRKTSTSSLHSVSGPSSRTPSRAPSRRTSLAHASSPVAKSPLRTSPPEYIKPPPTANTIARDYFKTELATHHSPLSTLGTETVVILHDACYGHRFSRPKTSKGALSTIVERPERIKAGVLGVAMAYVRLGERHCDGSYPIHPSLNPTTIPNIPFRIYKTERRLPITSQAVTNVHGTKWMEELKMMCDVAEAKLSMGGKELQRPEMNRGADGPPAKFHEGDLYLCSESLEAFEGALGAVCEAVDRVFTSGPRRAFVAVRPPGHHCSASYPSGFCWVNNVHVGIMHAILNHGLTHAAIIDFDLHHGDGSQAIAWAHNSRGVNMAKNAAAWKKASIGYFSLHDINSYPCEMGDEEKVKNASLCIDNAHGQNMWNVHLGSWDSEQEFWDLYESKYSIILEKTRSYLKTQSARVRALNLPPKAAIFFSAGFDASEWETKGMQRHNVNVPTEFYARIAQDVVKLAAEEGLSVDGRVISVLEGGYSDRALYSGIFSHLSGLSGDQTVSEPTRGRPSLGYEMGQRIGAIQEGQPIPEKDPSAPSLHPYNPSWWASSELDELEVAMGNRPASPRMIRQVTPGNYSTPTAASIGKAVDPTRLRRMASGHGVAYSRPPTPPPPDVHWTVAAHELSRLLIPSDRQVDSCKPEDLNAEATKARRDRQSILNPDLVPPPPPAPAPVERPTSRMSLRERKPVTYAEEDDKQSKNRRRTVAGAPALSADKATARGIPSDANGAAKRPGRRLSAASSVVSTASTMPYETNGVASRPDTSMTIRPETSMTMRPDTSMTMRPETSMTIRPESSMSVRTQAGPSLNVKKTRAPAAKKEVPKKEAPKTTRTVKKPAVPAKTTPPQAGQPSQPPKPKPSPAAGPEDDMDKLTAGMKKIKINLITKTQKEERAKAAQAAQAAPKAATPPVVEQAPAEQPPVEQPIVEQPIVEQPPIEQPSIEQPQSPAFQEPKPSTPAPTEEVVMTTPPPIVTPPQEDPVVTPPKSEPITTPPMEPEDLNYMSSPDPLAPTPQVPKSITEPMLSIARPDPLQIELPASSPVVTPAVETPPGQDVFINYQPEGPAPITMTPTEPLKWLPPNENTPVKPSPGKSPAKSPTKVSPPKKSPTKPSPAKLSPPRASSSRAPVAKMKRANLPVFTSTSAIPFAQPKKNGSPKPKAEPVVKAEPAESAKSAREIPETPQK